MIKPLEIAVSRRWPADGQRRSLLARRFPQTDHQKGCLAHGQEAEIEAQTAYSMRIMQLMYGDLKMGSATQAVK